MNHKEKIAKYLDYKGINPNQFYKKCGFGNGFLNSGKYFGTDKLKIILDNYQDLNFEWLLFDEGEMTLKANEIANEPFEDYNDYKNLYLKQLEENSRLKDKIIDLMDEAKASSKAS